MNAITYKAFTRMVEQFIQLGINEGIFSKEIEDSSSYNSVTEVMTYNQKKALVTELILVSLYGAGGQIIENDHTIEGKEMAGYYMGYNKGCDETKRVFLDGLHQYAIDFARREKYKPL